MLHELPHRESHRSTQLTPAEKTCLELLKAEIEEIKEGKTEKQLKKEKKTDVLQRLLAKLEEKARFSNDEQQRKRIMEKRREKLVKFRDEQIPLYEYWALEKMVEDINNDYKEQRSETGEQEPKDLKLDDIVIKVKDESVVFINLEFQKFRKAPLVVRTLTNLHELCLYDNPKLEDISALSGLTNLQRLWISNNPKLEDIRALEHLDNLTFVNLRNTGIDKEDSNTERILEILRKRCITGFYV